MSISYWDRESWTSYFKNDVLPLYSSAITITGLWQRLKEKTHGKFLSEVVKEIAGLEQAFVGGTSPPEKYEEDSLARIYKELLGARVNLREYYFLKKLGREPQIPCKVEPTEIVSYIERISVLLEQVVTQARDFRLLSQSSIQEAAGSSKRNVDEIFKEPARISEKFADFLTKAIGVTATYNEYTRFIWSLRKIPKKYIKELYPELLKPGVFRFIEDLLGLREYVAPQVKDPEIAEMYTILSFDYQLQLEEVDKRGGGYMYITIDGKEYRLSPQHIPYLGDESYKTIGGCICRLNELIWHFFSAESGYREFCQLVCDEIPYPRAEWELAEKSRPPFSGRDVYRLGSPDSYETLSELDEWLPAVITGRAELVKDRTGELFVFTRW
jgi:hypothetical protein